MQRSILRILDANANRAREALRVLEDYARFVLDDPELSAPLKQVRHELAEALSPLPGEAILHRDTPGDVGTDTKTPGELQRSGVSHVITAAGKRLGEALRAIEEFLKIEQPDRAARVETLRYRFYELEMRLARTLRPPERFQQVRLYVLITESLCRGNWLETAEQAILGGADCLQLREKDLESGELLRRAQALVQLCRKHDVLCIINDRPDIAIMCGADGVHVGQDDLPAAEVRRLIGQRMLLGVSTHNLEQARQAVRDGADYIGVGPVFPSQTKPRDFLPGLAYAKEAADQVPLPAVAIAGVTADNVEQVLATGVRAIAVTAAVVSQDDPRAAAARLKAGGQAFLPVTGGHSSPPDPSVAAVALPVHKTRRHLPHWDLRGSTYYVTFRLAAGKFTREERKIVLEHLKAGCPSYYDLLAGVIMPDHVHLIIRPRHDMPLSRIMKGIKGVSARRINEHRGTRGRVWQEESWDRIIRAQEELEEKLRYMLNNPVRRGLVQVGWDWDAWFYNRPQV